MVGRTVVIGDIPWVAQSAEAFLSKVSQGILLSFLIVCFYPLVLTSFSLPLIRFSLVHIALQG